MKPNRTQIHGHRGARGLYPENTLEGFRAAIGWGVDAIEMDVCVSADDVLVLSHDLALNPCLARDAEGNWLRAPTPAIRSLTRAELSEINVGAPNPACLRARRWPEQRALPHAGIPALSEVVELAAEMGAHEIIFNIELKSDPYQPGLTPGAGEFAALLLEETDRLGIGERLFLQSFDWNLLAALRELRPVLEPGHLTARRPGFDTLASRNGAPSAWTGGLEIGDFGGSIPRLVRAAGGTVWSSDHRDLTPGNIVEARELGLRIYTWTVNEETEMERLLQAGVDAITTDYPPRLRKVMAEMGCELPSCPRSARDEKRGPEPPFLR